MYTAIEALTEEHQMAALRLRYDVFYREQQDERYADHDKQIWVDCDDGPRSRLIVGLDSTGQVAGTMRFTRVLNEPFIAQEAYDFRKLSQVTGVDETDIPQVTARVDRAVVSLGDRGKGLLSIMQGCVEDIARGAGVFILIGIPGASNPRSIHAFHKLGWQDYSHVSTYHSFTAMHIFKKLEIPTGRCRG